MGGLLLEGSRSGTTKEKRVSRVSFSRSLLEELQGDHAATSDNASFEQDVDQLATELF